MNRRCLQCSTPYDSASVACPACGAINPSTKGKASSDAIAVDPMLCIDCGVPASLKFDGQWRCRDHYSRYRHITHDTAPRRDRSAEIRAMIDMLKRKKPSKQWAYDLQAREVAGEMLTALQSRYWREALRTDLPERVVGEDDEAIA